ncbi:hypothetical protein V2I01_07875 [Micromonospora sp. BRA006-A]|nr:hypothetical protein [Micromonospora sp. BRA006-A]
MLDRALRVAGGVVTVWAGVPLALLDLIFATWAWRPCRAAPAGCGRSSASAWWRRRRRRGGDDGAVGRFAHRSTGTRWAVVLGALPWFLVIVVGGFRTVEGDLALAGDNVLGLALIVAGAVTFAVLGFGTW